jgi:hypothetical protein
MKIVLGGRRSGKTTELIKRAEEVDGYIVCLDRKRVEAVFTLSLKLKSNIRYPITLQEAINYKGFFVPFLVDDLDAILFQLLKNHEIKAVSFCASDDEITNFNQVVTDDHPD